MIWLPVEVIGADKMLCSRHQSSFRPGGAAGHVESNCQHLVGISNAYRGRRVRVVCGLSIHWSSSSSDRKRCVILLSIPRLLANFLLGM
jgi:hypothetical protein